MLTFKIKKMFVDNNGDLCANLESTCSDQPWRKNTTTVTYIDNEWKLFNIYNGGWNKIIHPILKDLMQKTKEFLCTKPMQKTLF